jgi:carbamoyl-phosphate synthase large subunit
MIGKKLRDFELRSPLELTHISVKESVFPFSKFPGVDTLLGPEMKSTGEVMGIGDSFGQAFAKSQIAAGNTLPTKGTAFFSVRDEDKLPVFPAAKKLGELGFRILATSGTARFFRDRGLSVLPINKVAEGSPHIVDKIEKGEVQMVINTPEGPRQAYDSFSIRRTALVRGVPYFTTVAAALAAVDGIETLLRQGLLVKAMQDYHQKKIELNRKAV